MLPHSSTITAPATLTTTRTTVMEMQSSGNVEDDNCFQLIEEEMEREAALTEDEQQQQQQRLVINSTSKRQSGRSVIDYNTEDELFQALASCTISAGKPCGYPPKGRSDWVLPIKDTDAEEQTINNELHRLLVLKSYLLLDAEKEEAFDKLTEEACQYYNVPTSLISLIDLGRQFLFSNTGANGVRETSRIVAFCSHTILSKSGICVVPDCTKDPRFQNNELVTQGPKLRFYAGAPLISPEGYKLGTFCVEGPEPRPDGLTIEEQNKLMEYASKTMDLMVERRKKILTKSKAFNLPENESLRRHAAVATNLGSILYDNHELVHAMRLFQESVQTLMHVEEEASVADSTLLPSIERQEAMYNLLNELSNDSVTMEQQETYVAQVKSFFDGTEFTIPPLALTNNGHAIHGIPALFSAASKLKSIAGHRHLHGLIFAEPFRVSLEKDVYTGDLRTRPIDDRSFVIPLEQCSKATLFNMGLIHYHWGGPDSAMQFFDLAASLSQQHDALVFDPVILGCLNNMAQIHLQHGRPNDAMELLSDAVTRGNAALVAMYGSDDNYVHYTTTTNNSTTNTGGVDINHNADVNMEDIQKRQYDIKRTRRLRKKLSRTVMNMGHVHFVRCDYDASLATCNDALMLLHTNMGEMEVAAVWYNSALLNYYKGNKLEALKYLDKYLDMATSIIGRTHLQYAEGLHRKGQLLFEMGHLYESMPCLAEALEVRRKKLGEHHPAVADSYILIGKVLVEREEYDSALMSLERGLAVQRALAQDDISFEVAQTLLEIGRVYHAKGQLQESVQVYTEVLELTKKFFGDKHPFAARISNILGNLYLESGSTDESVTLFSEAMKIQVEQQQQQQQQEDQPNEQQQGGSSILNNANNVVAMSGVQDPLSSISTGDHHPASASA